MLQDGVSGPEGGIQAYGLTKMSTDLNNSKYLTRPEHPKSYLKPPINILDGARTTASRVARLITHALEMLSDRSRHQVNTPFFLQGYSRRPGSADRDRGKQFAAPFSEPPPAVPKEVPEPGRREPWVCELC